MIGAPRQSDNAQFDGETVGEGSSDNTKVLYGWGDGGGTQDPAGASLILGSILQND